MNLLKVILSPIEWEMEDFCESHGYKVVKGTPDLQKTSVCLPEGNCRSDSKGKWLDTGGRLRPPKVHLLDSQLHGAQLFHRFFEKWRLEAKPKVKTVAEWELVISRFNALHGALRIGQITKAHIVSL